MKIGIAQCFHPIREALQRSLAIRPGHEIIWIAENGAEAFEQCMKVRPDLLLMELTLPEMDGVEATRRIMADAPCAIVIVTSGVSGRADRIFQAMGYGALDAVDILVVNRGSIGGVAEFRKKIDAVAALVATGERDQDPAPSRGWSDRVRPMPLVAIGASAGGPAAIARILQELPADFPAAVVIVQPIQALVARSMVEWLRGRSRLPVRLANDNHLLEPGVALLAYANGHLKLSGPNRLRYGSDSRAVHQPSIDLFFESVSTQWPGRAAGVLLTGIGRDGAAGLSAMRARGHDTIAQDRATSVAYGMPGAAAAMGAAAIVLPLERIAERLIVFSGASVASAGRAKGGGTGGLA